MAIHIGCSGWHYLHWRGNFYAKETKIKDFMGRYIEKFNTVEINNSFYRLPSEKTLMLWREKVQEDFTFAVKASRYITHTKKLQDSDEAFQTFFNRMSILGHKLGPILFQLPPKWNYNDARFKEFVGNLPPHQKYVFEFRNNNWLREEVFEILHKHDMGFCIHDMPGSQTPEVITSKIIYIRFHGSQGKYQGSYSDKTLDGWANKIQQWKKDHQIYIYFNNDIEGFAPENALKLQELINN